MQSDRAYPESVLGADVAARARNRTLLERKRRVWLNLLIFIMVSAAMTLVALRNRDSQAVRQGMEVGRRAAAYFQEHVDAAGKPSPLRTDDQELRKRCGPGLAAFAANPLYSSAARLPVAVIWSSHAVRLFLNPTGRVVVLFDGRTFLVQWMSESEFRQQRSELGAGSDR